LPEDIPGYLASNRALWDEWTAIHETSSFYDLEGFKAGGVRLRPYEVEEVGDVAGKDLLHLQCHFGIDTISWARLGARVTGADFSERGIALARRVAEEIGIAARFVHSNVYDLPDAPELRDERFDVVYTSRGVIGWLPDLFPWARVVAHFLKPGGVFYVTEGHPTMWVFDDAEDVEGLQVAYPYYARPEPLAFEVQGSYAEPTAAVKSAMEYSWPHSMGEIVTAIAEAGLVIEFLHEFPFLDWPMPFLEDQGDGTWRLPASQAGEIPLTFSLRAHKPWE